MQATRELMRENWSHYLDVISDDLLNESVSIEITQPSTPTAIEADGLALQLLTYDGRSDVFGVEVARGGPRLPSVLRHLVSHPTRIVVDSHTSLAPTTIAVEAADGTKTLIRIKRSAAFAG
jgi:Family of unknown function (DUF5335)